MKSRAEYIEMGREKLLEPVNDLKVMHGIQLPQPDLSDKNCYLAGVEAEENHRKALEKLAEEERKDKEWLASLPEHERMQVLAHRAAQAEWGIFS